MKKETLVLGGIGLISVILLVGAAFILGGGKSEETDTEVVDTAKLVGEKRHLIGSDSAKVTVVEFADFQCPACGAAHPVVQQVLSDYGDDVEYIFRHFPLPGHKNARLAARAAEAAGVQGKFFEMHDMLFENQEEWSESNKAEEIFTGYAESLGLEKEKFLEDLKNDDLNQAIQNDQNTGIELGVNSTPTFFIDGVMHPGVVSYQDFKEIIEKKEKQ